MAKILSATFELSQNLEILSHILFFFVNHDSLSCFDMLPYEKNHF